VGASYLASASGVRSAVDLLREEFEVGQSDRS